MNNLIYDEALCFGKLAAFPAAGAAGNFPDVLNMGKKAGAADSYPGERYAGAERQTADILFESPAGGTGVAATVQGSADGSANWTDIGRNAFTLAQMKRGPCKVAISPNEFQYLRVSVTPAGTFAGSMKCYLNAYAGK
jgi:hypothetical protein